jgi:hypothetical protein
MRWLTIIAGALSIYGGAIGLLNDPLGFGRPWILYAYQILFGLILIGNEWPVHAINQRFPGLQGYEGKGLFLVFISTFMFGSSKPMASGSDGEWQGLLADACALALFVKGVFCVCLAACGTSCPLCFRANAQDIAGGRATGV